MVLGGGVFDTGDTAFHDRVAGGVHAAAPRAVLVRLDAPPVLGAALIGLDAIGAPPTPWPEPSEAHSPRTADAGVS